MTIAPRPTRALRPEAALKLSAEIRDAGGRAVEDAPLAWSSSDSTVVAVNATGRIVALRPGRAHVVAASGAGRDSVMITVRKPGARPRWQRRSRLTARRCSRCGPGRLYPRPSRWRWVPRAIR